MKIVAIIPIKKNSKRVKGKNFKQIHKKPLYRYLLDKLKYAKFDEKENTKTEVQLKKVGIAKL